MQFLEKLGKIWENTDMINRDNKLVTRRSYLV